MAVGIPAQLAALRKEIAELRADNAAAGEALAAILHHLDEMDRCLGVVAVRTKHLHNDLAQRQKQRRLRKK